LPIAVAYPWPPTKPAGSIKAKAWLRFGKSGTRTKIPNNKAEPNWKNSLPKL